MTHFLKSVAKRVVLIWFWSTWSRHVQVVSWRWEKQKIEWIKIFPEKIFRVIVISGGVAKNMKHFFVDRKVKLLVKEFCVQGFQLKSFEQTSTWSISEPCVHVYFSIWISNEISLEFWFLFFALFLVIKVKMKRFLHWEFNVY